MLFENTNVLGSQGNPVKGTNAVLINGRFYSVIVCSVIITVSRASVILNTSSSGRRIFHSERMSVGDRSSWHSWDMSWSCYTWRWELVSNPPFALRTEEASWTRVETSSRNLKNSKRFSFQALYLNWCSNFHNIEVVVVCVNAMCCLISWQVHVKGHVNVNEVPVMA